MLDVLAYPKDGEVGFVAKYQLMGREIVISTFKKKGATLFYFRRLI